MSDVDEQDGQRTARLNQKAEYGKPYFPSQDWYAEKTGGGKNEEPRAEETEVNEKHEPDLAGGVQEVSVGPNLLERDGPETLDLVGGVYLFETLAAGNIHPAEYSWQNTRPSIPTPLEEV